MSHPGFPRNSNIGRTVRPAFNNYYEQQKSAVNQNYEVMHKPPTIYSQPPAMVFREPMPESEPMSEYTEMPMTFTRSVTPASFHQTSVSPRQTSTMMHCNFNVPQQRLDSTSLSCHDMQSPKMYHDHQGFNSKGLPSSSPYLHPSTPLGMMPHPSPSSQRLVANYNPDQSLIMKSMCSVPASTEFKKTSPQNSKIPRVLGKNSSQVPKLNSVSRKRYFIGTIEQVVQWHKMIKQSNMMVVYEVAGILDKLSSNQKGLYQMILRSEQKSSNALQAVFYTIDRDLPRVKIGELVTFVGRMIATRKLQVFDMWPTAADGLVGIKRISFLCQRTLQEANLALPEP